MPNSEVTIINAIEISVWLVRRVSLTLKHLEVNISSPLHIKFWSIFLVNKQLPTVALGGSGVMIYWLFIDQFGLQESEWVSYK